MAAKNGASTSRDRLRSQTFHPHPIEDANAIEVCHHFGKEYIPSPDNPNSDSHVLHIRDEGRQWLNVMCIWNDHHRVFGGCHFRV